MTENHTASEKPNLNGLSDRERCLAQAREYITRDRTGVYGSAEDNFGNIARILNSLGFKRGDEQAITTDDVAVMMIAVKLARLMNSPGHEDSWIDLAGYAACGMQTANTRLTTPRASFDNGPAQAKRELSEQVAGKTRYRADCGHRAIHKPHRFSNTSQTETDLYCDGVPRMQ